MEKNIDQVQKSKPGKGKCIIGCGCGCLTLLTILVAAGILGGIYLIRIYEKWQADFSQLGFHKIIEQQAIIVSQDIQEPTLFCGQFVNIDENITTNVAIIAQKATINGSIEGDLYFIGQHLQIQAGATIKGNLNVLCQLVSGSGDVKGEITGSYQVLKIDQKATK